MVEVLLTGLADESSESKRLEEQLAVTRALGMGYYSPRFVNLGSGTQNVVQLSPAEVDQMVALQQQYGVRASSLASPLGKVKLLDVDDGTRNRFVDFDRYLSTEVDQALRIARALGARLVRGFSFYPPKGDDPWDHLALAAERLRAIAERCAEQGLLFGLEVEANLVGRTGELEAALWEQVNHPSLGLVFDGGNLVCQGYTSREVYQQYLAMKPGLLWLHVKDYLTPPMPETERLRGHVAENALKHFVPADRGDSGYPLIFKDLALTLQERTDQLQAQGVDGFFVDLEPHLKGGGQFGGFSGPDGYGVALRALSGVLDGAGVGYHLAGYEELRP
ncbi:MAG TPA: sugar phosphate isomerase/epimerase family protein [Armatimonadota bacterium]|jgi:sugar phosphate isomerase/epimerase